MTFKRPSLPALMAQIDQDLLSRLPGAQATLATRLTRALATSQAGVTHGLYGYLQWLERQLFPMTCDDELLHLHSIGVPRRQSAKASGEVSFQGSDGAVIVTGTRLQLDGQVYETTEEAVIVAGEAKAPVVAGAAGVAGEQAAGTALRLVSPISGVSAVAMVGGEGIRGGADLETYRSWRERILRRRARVPRGGARGDWEDWALEVPGVTRAWEDPLGMGPGSVVVRIMADEASDGPLPSRQLLDAVVAYIKARCNVQASVYVVAPDTRAFHPQLRVTPDTEAVRGAVAQALADLVEREGKPGGTLLISRIRATISSAPGVKDYDLQWPTADVTYPIGALPIWDDKENVTWV